MHGPPAEFGTQLIGIDRVTSIMPRTVTHPVECVLRTPHKPQNHTHYGNVAHFAVRADQIRFADATARQNLPYRRRVVFRMNPVAHVLAGAVQFRPRAFQNGCDLSWNEFFHMLVWPVIVGTVGNGGAQAVCARPRAHQMVGRGFRRAVRA